MGDILLRLEELIFHRPLYFTAAVLIVVTLVIKYGIGKRLRRPPGPWGVPVLGYMPFLSHMEHLDFLKLHKIYGKIFRLKMGMRPAVVVADFQAIKEAFNKDEISERPPKLFELPNPEVTQFLEMVDKEWKESRRFALSSLRTLGMGKNKLEVVIEEEIGGMVEHLRSLAGSDVNMHGVLYPVISNVIISLICGKSLKEDPRFTDIVDLYTKSFFPYMRIKAYLCYLPIVKPFISYLHPEIKTLARDMLKLEERLWKEIKSVEDSPDGPGADHYMGHFITEMRNPGSKGTTFTREILNGNSQLFLAGGLDTTMTTIEWTLLLMAQHPEIQERAYKEIVGVIGKERPPTFSEREALPYLDAVISEVSRFKTVGPLADPHWTTSDTTVGGYDVPKGTVVFANVYAVHNDPDLWTRPEKFNPDRFLTSDGKRIRDPEYLIPFSIGKRFCPGEKLARVEVFLFVCSLLQNFKFLPPTSGIDMEAELDIVFHAKHPIVRVQARD